MRTLFARDPWQRNRGAALLALCVLCGAAHANPTGPTVIHGQAGFHQQGRVLTVNNSPGTIIQWRGFSIAAGETTRFVQPSPASAVLNRVAGPDPSSLLGSLLSNGRVFLVNPNGIVIGNGATVDVAGFVASSLQISDADFLSGRMRFAGSQTAGEVWNHGAVAAAAGGNVYLVAPAVGNAGAISVRDGDLVLAAGRSIEIFERHEPGIRVALAAPGDRALNLGRLVAERGRVGMFAGAIRNDGLIQANSAAVNGSGAIVLRAERGVVHGESGRLAASGVRGGRIEVRSAAGEVLVHGAIEARGEGGRGGTVELIGPQVALLDGASVDASGRDGGGSIGVGARVAAGVQHAETATSVFTGPRTAVRADALESGDGGTVKVLAQRATAAFGPISARGGAGSGNGGFVEVSAGGALVWRGRADLGAPKGRLGTLLLDPAAIVIEGGSADGDGNGSAAAFAGSGGMAPGTVLFGDAGPTIVYESEIEEQSKTASIVLEATASVTVGAGEFNYNSSGNPGDLASGVLALAPGASLVIRTRNQLAAEAGAIQLAGGFHGARLQIVTSGTGTIDIQSGVGGDQAAPVTLPELRSDASIAVRAGPAGTASDLVLGRSLEAPTIALSAGRDVVAAGGAGANEPVTVNTGGSLTINAGGGLKVHAGMGSGSSASLLSSGDQSIEARYVEVLAQAGNGAEIRKSGTGAQTVSTSGMNERGEGLLIRSLDPGGEAVLRSDGTQTITVSDADFVRVLGEGGRASIEAPLGSQVLRLQGGGANALEVGSAAATGISEIYSDFDQTVEAGLAGQRGSITVRGGTAVALPGGTIAVGTGTIGRYNALQRISSSGEIAVIGGSALNPGGATAAIIAWEQQMISANALRLQGGSSGEGNFAQIDAFGAPTEQNITVGSGGLLIQGGSSGVLNFARLRNNSAGTQSVTVNDGGTLELQGGSGGSGNEALLLHFGSSQTIAFGAGGSLTLAGGAAGSDNIALLQASRAQTITGSPAITLQGGAGGTGNLAVIEASVQDRANDPLDRANADQTISAHYVEVLAQGGNDAKIEKPGSGVQTVLTSGMNDAREGLLIRTEASGGEAVLHSGGTQTITVSNADFVRVVGEGGPASIRAPGGSQVLRLQGGGANALEVGSAAATGISEICSDFDQTVEAGLAGQRGSITVRGGTAREEAGTIVALGRGRIGSFSALQRVSSSGEIAVFGGSAPGPLGSDPSGGGATAGIIARGLQDIRANALRLQGGSVGDCGANACNFAQIDAFGAPTEQNITVGSGGLLIQGGSSGVLNFARLRNNSAGTQSVTVDDGGTLELQGGSGGSGNEALLLHFGSSQTIAFGAGGSLTLAGGAAGSDNVAQLQSLGSQTISGFPAIGLQGGAGGSGNHATVEAQGGQLIGVGAGDLTLAGGEGSGASARIIGEPQVMLVTRGLIRMRGGAQPDAFARIEAGAGSLTRVDFLARDSGGFLVDGIEGAVTSGSSGFFANGERATLGTNLFLVYHAFGEALAGALSAVVAGLDRARSSPTRDDGEDARKRRPPVEVACQ